MIDLIKTTAILAGCAMVATAWIVLVVLTLDSFLRLRK
jgi:hypothetical protein